MDNLKVLGQLTKNDIKQKRAELVGTRGSHPGGTGAKTRRTHRGLGSALQHWGYIFQGLALFDRKSLM